MDALLTTIVLWLSSNFGLLTVHEHPRIQFLPAVEIALRRYQAFTPEKRAEVIRHYSSTAGTSKPVALYDDAARAILLPDNWSGATPAELSVLVHEIVHHLQNLGQLSYECPRVREQLAYAAQERWLALFGRNLASEFNIDAFTIKVLSSCGY
jgi:Domain of unknown function (DUF6647)